MVFSLSFRSPRVKHFRLHPKHLDSDRSVSCQLLQIPPARLPVVIGVVQGSLLFVHPALHALVNSPGKPQKLLQIRRPGVRRFFSRVFSCVFWNRLLRLVSGRTELRSTVMDQPAMPQELRGAREGCRFASLRSGPRPHAGNIQQQMLHLLAVGFTHSFPELPRTLLQQETPGLDACGASIESRQGEGQSLECVARRGRTGRIPETTQAVADRACFLHAQGLGESIAKQIHATRFQSFQIRPRGEDAAQFNGTCKDGRQVEGFKRHRFCTPDRHKAMIVRPETVYVSIVESPVRVRFCQ
jgi:hypothetical protein